jgi:predicted transcriptional regulator
MAPRGGDHRRVVNAPPKRQLAAATAIRQRRLALGRTAADIARTAGFSTSKILRIERAPERARLGDVLLLDETLQRLELTAAETSGFHSALSSALGAWR